jgi:hypothetical protein
MPQCPACNQSVPATAVNCPHCNIALNLQQSAVSPTRDSSGIGIVVVVVVATLGLLFLFAGFAVFAVAARSTAIPVAGSVTTYAVPSSTPMAPAVTIEVEEPLLGVPTAPETPAPAIESAPIPEDNSESSSQTAPRVPDNN